ncbi:MAG: serine/threonine protein kinase [Microcoleaceae cyanobacterium]
MLSPGTVLNTRFRLKQSFNTDSIRHTWLAEDLMFQDQVVLKLLALSGSMDWDDLKLLEREAQILQQLTHPRIAKYRDYFALNTFNQWFGLVTEYVPGVSLKQKLEKHHRFTQEQLQWIAQEVLEILQYLHQLAPPVLHRDIKPSNLIWGTDHQIYLIDFGCVQLQPRLPGATFTVVGTYGYTPIEQFGGETVPASDLYALGTTLVHLLTGIPPAELPQKDFQIQFQDRVHSQLDAQFSQWLERLIKPTVGDRFQSAQQALIALNASVSGLIQSPENTGIQLSKSTERLTIEIPSRFSIEYVRPFRRTAAGSMSKLKHRFQQIPWLVRGQIAGVLILTAFALQLLPVPLEELGLNLAHTALYLPVMLLVLGVPVGLASLILLLNSGLNYFERVRIDLDDSNCEISWRSAGWPKRKKVELSQIQQVNLAQVKNLRGHLQPSLEIAVHKPRLFLFSQRRALHFGQQLREEELQWLKQEIWDWITSHSTSRSI